jgi:Dyp-type peroxidase family
MAPRVFDPDSDLLTGPVVPGAPEEPILAVDEIQGDVLPGSNALHQVLLGVSFDATRVDAARRWLDELRTTVSSLAQVNDFRNVRRTALRRSEPPPPSPMWTSVAFDAVGVELLHGPLDGVRDDSFCRGMPALAAALGDPRDPNAEGHPSNWAVGGSLAETPRALVKLAGDGKAELLARADQLAAAATALDLDVIFRQEGDMLEGDVEHFGFRDGISQVGARGRLSSGERHFLTRRYIDPEDPRALTHSRPGQPLVWPGQFVFGYPKQRDDDPRRAGPIARAGQDWMDNGSFLVFRRLRQDVAAFTAFVMETASKLAHEPGFAGMTPERLAALLVGRWPNGTALMRSSTVAEPDPMGDRLSVNHFGFFHDADAIGVIADAFVQLEPGLAPANDELRTVAGAPGDRFGRRCPGIAHIRKVNPRDLPTDKGGPDRTLTFQVLRRGITWGKPYPTEPGERARDDGQRGLLFACYCTSIEDQFEVLNTDWMNQANAPEGNTGHDLLVGQGAGSRERVCAIPAADMADSASISTMAHWVVTTGGGYFFAPSISALGLLASRGPGD